MVMGAVSSTRTRPDKFTARNESLDPHIRRRKPYLIACGRPCQAALIFPLLGQGSLLNVAVRGRQPQPFPLVSGSEVCSKNAILSPGARKSWLADPPGGIVENFPDGIFQAVATVNDVDYGEVAVRPPGRIPRMREHLARRAS